MKTGALIVSLDLEQYWGVRDRLPLERYRAVFGSTDEIVERTLSLFCKYGIHATWATVGLLFFDTLSDAFAWYQSHPISELDSYAYLKRAAKSSDPGLDAYHCASGAIEKILSYEHQEVASHTFSHFLCLKPGASMDAFISDLFAARSTALSRFGLNAKTIVFPRNKFSEAHLAAARRAGFSCYRGNERFWIYRLQETWGDSPFLRALRFIDTYFPLSPHNAYELGSVELAPMINIPSSRFLRPYSARLSSLEPLKIKRILSSLAYAAENNEAYHLWWHPHDFGANTEMNFRSLESILQGFLALKEAGRMTSLNMSEASAIALKRSERSRELGE